MLTITTTKGGCSGKMADVVAWLAEYQPGGVTLELGALTLHVELPEGDDAPDWAAALAAALVGEQVQGGTTADDYDYGTVIASHEDGTIDVAWECGGEARRTELDGLSSFDEDDLERFRAQWRQVRGE